MKVTSYGAAETVTGSCHLVETNGHRFLIDCGMFQGSKNLNRRNYAPFEFDPATIDFLILTHGHIDHCGLLPKLTRYGFSGSIYTNPATADLLSAMLMDSAFIQEKDTEHENRRRERRGFEPREPLYTRDDVPAVLESIRRTEYDSSVEISPELRFILRDAGHIIGSSIVQLFVTEGNATKTVIFSGDLGQWNVPIIEDPSIIPRADYVFIETTYGDRLHKEPEPRKESLFHHIKETYERGGKLLIPSFALERTQELLYTLSELIHEKPDFPNIKIYLDSPLAIKVTEVFHDHPEIYDEDARARKDTPFKFPELVCTPKTEDSMALNKLKEPAIIIAGSGMCTGGRIRHHLKHGIWDPRNTVLFVGYQAEGTLGRHLLDGADEVRMMGDIFRVKAHIERIHAFSAHADRDELLGWIDAFIEKPKRIHLIHGEKRVMESFAELLNQKGYETHIQVAGIAVELN
ncbi:MAG: MBL fold metallo-hydrolase [Spirochaetales bacterium]|uniref:MBL fold metallo-hydrolase n=1 Tax=Candidatus Thalassospirochaeta sargassi TaxID=3119039 RepID=A0AAJ1MML4_9SPIO|nr:MBL fold metallo-hydrolase [Spirochaetales bacterium]